ncbi:MAG: TolC family protein [Candidatus Symbiothrix sp.]|jgi:outer membrane protein TolC|nr:TolC family protein [Candidatus Symbiothrix sp.]
MKQTKKCVLFLLLMLSVNVAGTFGQLTLTDCQTKARENFPLIKKARLIEQSKNFTLSNVSKAWLPQLQLKAQATYQSDVTSIEFPPQMQAAMGIDGFKVSKDQYQATMGISQMLWDGGATAAQRKMIRADAEADLRQTDVEIYALEERINQLFFGVLLCHVQLEQNQLLTDELQRNYDKIEQYVASGLANQADLDGVKVEQLNAQQVRTQILATRKAWLEMLGMMIDEQLDENTELIQPKLPQEAPANLIQRPELQWFEAQNRMLDSQKSLLDAALMPKFGLFAQGGYGRPGLNMLSDKLDFFYIGGVQLSWNFGSLYTRKNDLRKIDIGKSTMETQRELFLYNTRLSISRQNQEVQRLKALMHDDDEIIRLRENIRQATAAKLANGTATVTDLMRELTQENIAKQTKATHEIDLLMAIYQLQILTNHE